MFSGIIAACGRIEHVEQRADGIRITVNSHSFTIITAHKM